MKYDVNVSKSIANKLARSTRAKVIPDKKKFIKRRDRRNKRIKGY